MAPQATHVVNTGINGNTTRKENGAAEITFSNVNTKNPRDHARQISIAQPNSAHPYAPYLCTALVALALRYSNMTNANLATNRCAWLEVSRIQGDANKRQANRI